MKHEPDREGRPGLSTRPEITVPDEKQVPSTRLARLIRISRSQLVRLVLYYTAARLALIAGLAVIIMGINAVFDLEIPGVLSLFGALLLGFAISAIAFRSLRRRINDEVRIVDEKRLAIRNQQ